MFCNGTTHINAKDCVEEHGFSISARTHPNEILAFYNYLDRLSTFGLASSLGSDFAHPNRPVEEWVAYWQFVYGNMIRVNGAERRLSSSSNGQFFYIAEGYLKNMMPLLEIFARFRVPSAIAIPSTLKSLTMPGDLHFLTSTSMDQIEQGEGYAPVVYPFYYKSIRQGVISEDTRSLANKTTLSNPKFCYYCDLVIKTADKTNEILPY